MGAGTASWDGFGTTGHVVVGPLHGSAARTASCDSFGTTDDETE